MTPLSALNRNQTLMVVAVLHLRGYMEGFLASSDSSKQMKLANNGLLIAILQYCVLDQGDSFASLALRKT